MPEVPDEIQDDRSETSNFLKWIAVIVVMAVVMLILLALIGPIVGSVYSNIVDIM